MKTRCVGVLGRTHRALPVGLGQQPRRPRGDPAPHRVVPKLDGTRGTGSVYDRPSAVDGVRLLSLRPHRWTNRLEPRAVSPSAAGAPVDRARTRPLRSGRLPVRRRAVRPRPRRPGGASGLNGLRVSEACATNVEDSRSNAAIARCASSASATTRSSSQRAQPPNSITGRGLRHAGAGHRYDSTAPPLVRLSRGASSSFCNSSAIRRTSQSRGASDTSAEPRLPFSS